jgi:DNA-binding XRE family transcriptional regulator
MITYRALNNSKRRIASMTNTTLLEELINNSGLKRSYIAKKLGISRQALHKKIIGGAQFVGPEIKIMCELLKLETWAQIKPVFFAGDVSKNDYIAG